MSRLTWQAPISVTVVWTLIVWQLSCECSELNCSEAVCARVVTKCLLTEHCKCNFTVTGSSSNYTCHKNCFSCLAELCYDCCSCFGMCPKSSSSNPLNKVSSIEELDEPIPQLFEIYTADGGDDQVPPRYSTVTFEQEKTLKEIGSDKQVIRRNCTVAYMTKCMTSDECKTTCKSMGSSFSRWFHDGCCECVGNSCFDYGLGEARCANCPPNVEDVDRDDLYYGEDDDDDDDEFFQEIDDNHNHNHWTTNVTHKDEKAKDVWRDPGNRDWDN